MNGITDLSASALAEKLKSGELSARETTEAYIRRIEAVNPKLNAVVIPLFDEALTQARAADAKRARGDPLGPLHGVPVTIKEQYRVAGTQTTLGALSKRGNIYHEEGPLVTKLRQAGAIILGKTNIIQTLAGVESDNRLYGRSNNPWNLERTPGGSSGGEAAIIAAHGSALGLAGDYGGSTRLPASFCGLQGLKPTAGRLSNDDFAADLLGQGQEVFIPQPGPIARTVEDAALAMAVLAETSLGVTRDLVPPVPWPDPKRVRVAELRIGYYTENGYFPVAPALRRAVEEAAEALRGMGAAVSPVSPPDAAEAVRIFLGAISAGGVDDYLRLLDGEAPLPQVAGMVRSASAPPWVMDIARRIMSLRGQHHLAFVMQCAGPRPTKAYWELVEARTEFRAQFHRTMDAGGFDALICPPAALPALTHGSSGHLYPAAFTDALTYNVLGAPAGVVAATRVRPGEESDRRPSRDRADITARQVEEGSAGLPVGVQVVARHWREDIVLAVMAALEAHFRAMPEYPARPPCCAD